MTKIDLKKVFKHLYKPTARNFTVVEVPPMNFLMADGQGDPNISQDFKDAVEALFNLSFTLKFMLKKSEAYPDYSVMPLEGLWWSNDYTDFTRSNRTAWRWMALIMQPEFITRAMLDEAMRQVERKKNPPALGRVRFERFEEGSAVQILHVGPFAQEAATIAKMHHFIEESGWQIFGKHHEIYLSDFRRVAPEKLKTVIRQPFRRPT